MDLQLEERVILIVGGAGFIGSAVVDRVRREGATAVVASRNAPHDIQLDATDDSSVSNAVAEIIRRFGRLDGLVVTAAPPASTLDQAKNGDPEQVLGAFEAKAISFLRVANAVIPTMRAAGYGRIVGISGQNAFLTGNITGSVRNAATILIGKNLADSLAGTGVHVNVVSPATVTNDPTPVPPAGKGGDSTPAQIADLVAFLLSPLSFVSGESIAIGNRVLGVTPL
jgi:NAD(P)-dependent dehydrogenase (short-subunit alcohol dehydrogenase family)